MYNSLKHWILVKKLLWIASLDSFEKISTNSLVCLLEKYSISKVKNGVESHPFEHQALLRIWSLASLELQREKRNKMEWLKVMASCNALHEPYRCSFTEAVSLN